ncbi:MAG: GAF domain-containing protein [Chloroflexales bacterium]|nr:GAF domain-containing protein [Chloroflexales bacterium]
MGTNQPDNTATITFTSYDTVVQPSKASLHDRMTSLGLLFEATREPDPLPTLSEIARDLLQSDDVALAVPAPLSHADNSNTSLLIRPITIGGRAVGQLTARRTAPFDSDDQALASLIGQIIGAVIEQSALHSQLEQYRQQAQAHDDTLAQLLDFNRHIVSGGADYQQLALMLATQVPAMVGGERASLLLTPLEQPDTPQLVLSNGMISSPERARVVRDNGLAGMVLRERRPMILDETETDQRWLALAVCDPDEPTRCAMAVPLPWHSHLLGALTVTTTQSHAFGSSQLDLLELVACHVALALHNATLETKFTELTTALADLIHNLNDPLQAAQLGLQMILATREDENTFHFDVDDLAKITATLERIGAVSRQLAVLHRGLLSITQHSDSAAL